MAVKKGLKVEKQTNNITKNKITDVLNYDDGNYINNQNTFFIIES